MNILLDMDGVLSDFLGGAMKVCNKITGRTDTVEQYASSFGKWGIDEYYDIPIEEMWRGIEETEDFWFKLEPFPWAKDLYEWLSKIGDVTIVTSPSLDSDCASQKLMWLSYYLGIKSSDVFIGPKKYLMAGNGVLIDDWNVNCEKFIKAGGEAVNIPSNWNTNGVTFELIKNQIEKQLIKQSMSELAERKNKDKLKWHNFPLYLLNPMIEVAQFGGEKYVTYNYLKGGSQNQYLDCIKRHLTSYESPYETDLDPESQVNHLAHVAWNALVAIEMLKRFPELDDRFYPEEDLNS